jgi:hypothetical protein
MSRRNVILVGQVTFVITAITLSGCAHAPSPSPPVYQMVPPPPPPPPPPPIYQQEQQQQQQLQPDQEPTPPSEGPGSRPAAHPSGGSQGAIRGARQPALMSQSSDVVPEGTTLGQTRCGADDLDCNEALQRLGAFRNPPEMWVDTETTLEFAVGGTREAIARELGAGAELSEVRTVFVGRCMRVTLEPDPAIRILGPNGVTRRLARDRDRASWSWTIVPLNPGSPTLRARVEVLAQAEGGCSDRVRDQYTERVPVQIRITRWKGFLRGLSEAKSLGEVLKAVFASWEGAFAGLGSLATAIGGAWLAIKALGKRRRKKAHKKRSAPAAPAAADRSATKATSL